MKTDGDAALALHGPARRHLSFTLGKSLALAIELGTKTEVRLTAEGAEDVTNVVGGLDTSLEGGVPASNDTLDDLDTGEVDVVDGRVESALVSVEEVVLSSLAGVRAVEIRSSAHDNDAAEVNKTRDVSAHESLERGVILLGSGAVNTGVVGPEGGGVLEGLTKKSARVVDIGGGDVTLNDRGRLGTREVSGLVLALDTVVGAVSDGSVRVVKNSSLGELHREQLEVVVDLEDLSAINGGGVRVGHVVAEAEVASRPVAGHLAGVELVLEGDLNGIAGEGDGAEGANLGGDTSNTSDQEVSLRQVEEAGVSKGSDGRRGVDF